jgi:hypothetical protein
MKRRTPDSSLFLFGCQKESGVKWIRYASYVAAFAVNA